MVFFTCKLITAFVLCISAQEIFESFAFESKVVAFLLIAALIGWIAIVLFYSKLLEKLKDHISIVLVSNLVLCTTFSGLLMLEVMINDVVYWSFMIPLTINFALNIGYTH